MASLSHDGPALAGRVVAFAAGDEALLQGLRAGESSAVIALFDRYGALVERILARVLGADPDLGDLLHDTFAGVMAGVHQVRDASALRDWMTSVAVFRARTHLRQRARRRLWEQLFAPDELPDAPAPAHDDTAAEALRCTYELLGQLPADERIAFALRVLEGMELTDVARACGVSLATVKRRLQRAEARFRRQAETHPVLRDWVTGTIRRRRS